MDPGPSSRPLSPSSSPWASTATSAAASRESQPQPVSPPPTYLDDEDLSRGIEISRGGYGDAMARAQWDSDDHVRQQYGTQHLDLLGELQERAWRRQENMLSGRGADGSSGQRPIKSKPPRRRSRGDRRPPSSRGSDRDSVDSIGEESDGSEDSDWSGTGSTTSSYIREQEAQLREAWEQLELALKVVLCPLVGKWMGRRWAYWAFQRYQAHGGFSMRFFGLSWVPETRIPSWLAIFALPMTGGGAS
ncbi:unnamed protein product [Parajaminaea phylloscopi]